MFKVKNEGNDLLFWDKVIDTAAKTHFASGSQRDSQDGKGRYDLIPSVAIKRLARHFETGAKKYAERNWEKGQKLSQYYNSAMRHLQAILDLDLSEDHMAAVLWNVACMMHHVDKILLGELPRELDDIGIVAKIEQHIENQQTRDLTVISSMQDAVTGISNLGRTFGNNRIIASGTSESLLDRLKEYKG